MNDFPLNLVSVAVPRPVDGLFTYRISAELAPTVQVGSWVKVPFGRNQLHAFVVEPVRQALSEADLPAQVSLEKMKSVIEVGNSGEPVFTSELLALCRWTSDYYGMPLGEVLHCALPPAALGLRNARKNPRPLKQRTEPIVKPHELTLDQRVAFDQLESLRTELRPGKAKVALLHGVTGSGKTELYLELARRSLADGKGVLILVPEIALSSQLHRRFEESLGEAVGLWHSAVADGKRRDELAALQRGELRVVVGARSAVFAPVPDLGLIVIDEEHDPTYKQEDRVRYHARDLSVVRSRLTGAFVVLGSATPSLETRERVLEGKYSIAHLPKRIATGGMPTIELVDLGEEPKVEGIQAVLAEKTVEAIRAAIQSGGQVMIFLNRRGYAAFLLCEDCGEVVGCPNCSISLTVHKKRRLLVCHVCAHQEPIPDVCEKCRGDKLSPMGAGIESLEEDLPKIVPEAIPLRLDRDQVTSQTRLEKVLQDFREQKANILMGTQMLVKGHDFPGVTLVVVILADALFRWPDFRATERAYQILKQVAGRAGRGERPGKVLVQTFDPDHAVLSVLRGELSEETFIESERELRKVLNYPPFGRILRLRLESADFAEAKNRASSVAQRLTELQTAGLIDVLGPSEAFLERAKGIFRWDILVKSPEIQHLHRALRMAKELAHREKWSLGVDVDPYAMA